MKELRKCIFHVPNYIDEKATSGSQIRPIRMMQAFQENGYQVDVVMGNGKERKRQIKRIKAQIAEGATYDFMYSESSTMPTLLTEKNHLPTHPFLDFSFFKFIKKNNIPIGLFYRDIYWRFPIYKKEVPLKKRIFSIPMYYYDLYQYKKYLDILYLPSNKMKDYVEIDVKIAELPPGCTYSEEQYITNPTEKIKLFYVGGIGELYDLKKLMSVVKRLPFVELIVCCRENEWKGRKEYYQEFMCERIKIVHASGKELEKYYDSSDICLLFFASEGYRKFAMPIKLFEYLANLKPIIATEGSAAGEFVRKNNLGWEIPFEDDSLINLLKCIQEDKSILEDKSKKMIQARANNSWKARAEQVVKDLM